MLMEPGSAHDRDADAAAGDATADRVELARLWVQAQPTISAYVGSFVSDFHVTQDLVQEVAEAAATHFHKYDRERSFLTWTLSIARRRVMRHYRTRSRDKHVFSSEMMESVASAFERAAPLAQARRDALAECIREVRGRRRDILELRYASDLKPQAIAEELGTTSVAVRSLLMRARKSIETCVRKRLSLKGGDS